MWFVVLVVVLPLVIYGATYYHMTVRTKELRRKVARLRQEMTVHTLRRPMGAGTATVVMGSAVVAPDPLTLLFSQWRAIFGGKMKSLTMVMERARLESEYRMLKKARDLGCVEVACVRYATSDLGAKDRQAGIKSAEFFCYGTGIVPHGR